MALVVGDDIAVVTIDDSHIFVTLVDPDRLKRRCFFEEVKHVMRYPE
jgi:hypothetical protein